MYIAATRIADQFGCDAIGIQYQLGLTDVAPASDLVEGLLNNVERPPVYDASGRELYAGKALPHFNEVDECAGLDALVTNRGECRLLEAMGKETANIHVGTEEKRKAILKDLRRRKGNWLLGAAQAMADATEKDWRVWRERRQN